MRALFLSILFVILATSAVSQDVRVQKGRSYAPSGQKLDLCTPPAAARKTALIFIHGGGFSSGNRNAMLGYCKLLAKGGFPSATVSYRLTTKGHPYPAAANDVKAAVTWMKRRTGAKKIVLIGYSAGGTLAMTVGLADRAGVAGVVSAAGISDFAALRRTTPHRKLRQDIDTYLGKVPPAKASPLALASPGDPPVLLFHGTSDTLVPIAQSVAMAQRLKSKKSKVLLKTFPKAGHEIMLPNPHLKTLLQDLSRFLLAVDAA